MKKTVIFMALCLLLVIFIPKGDEKIYDSVIRFHVIANSNDNIDQEVKLKVRDELIQYASTLERTPDIRAAEKEINASLARFESLANKVLAQNGVSYRAKAILSSEVYPRREYLTFRLPYGEYKSLRVILGNGGGENWWCVLFPPVCLESASFEKEMTEAGVKKENIKILKKDSKEYEVRFFIVELFEKLKNKI